MPVREDWACMFHNRIPVKSSWFRAMIIMMDNRINMQKIFSRARDQNNSHPRFSGFGTAGRIRMRPCGIVLAYMQVDGDAVQCNGLKSAKTLLLDAVPRTQDFWVFRKSVRISLIHEINTLRLYCCTSRSSKEPVKKRAKWECALKHGWA